jgi:hypothetical protein
MPSKLLYFWILQQQVPKITTCTCKTLIKLKLTSNPKLTCTQITQNMMEVSWKKNDSCSINENWNTQSKWNLKVPQQVYPPSLILVISNYNSHNWPL